MSPASLHEGLQLVAPGQPGGRLTCTSQHTIAVRFQHLQAMASQQEAAAGARQHAWLQILARKVCDSVPLMWWRQCSNSELQSRKGKREELQSCLCADTLQNNSAVSMTPGVMAG